MRNVFHLLSLTAALFLVPHFYVASEVTSSDADLAMMTPPPHYGYVRNFLDSRMHLEESELDALTLTILTEARRADLEPELIVGLIHVESSGNPRAVSKVGAIGLMQLLPSTAAAMARELDLAWEGAESLYDPSLNVRLGIRYLGKLVNRFDDLDTALAAYNWGPTHIARVIRKGNSLPVRYTESVHRASTALI